MAKILGQISQEKQNKYKELVMFALNVQAKSCRYSIKKDPQDEGSKKMLNLIEKRMDIVKQSTPEFLAILDINQKTENCKALVKNPETDKEVKQMNKAFLDKTNEEKFDYLFEKAKTDCIISLDALRATSDLFTTITEQLDHPMCFNYGKFMYKGSNDLVDSLVDDNNQITEEAKMVKNLLEFTPEDVKKVAAKYVDSNPKDPERRSGALAATTLLGVTSGISLVAYLTGNNDPVNHAVGAAAGLAMAAIVGNFTSKIGNESNFNRLEACVEAVAERNN